jgi:hypothetical protein
VTTENPNTPVEILPLNSYLELTPRLQFIHSHIMDDEQEEKRFFTFRGEEFDLHLFEHTDKKDTFTYLLPSPTVWQGEYNIVYVTRVAGGNINVHAGHEKKSEPGTV